MNSGVPASVLTPPSKGVRMLATPACQAGGGGGSTKRGQIRAGTAIEANCWPCALEDNEHGSPAGSRG